MADLDNDDFWTKAAYYSIEHIVKLKYDDYVGQAVKTIKEFPKEARLSGDDSSLDTFWLEWAFQVQYEHAYAYEVYVKCIMNVIESIVSDKPDHEIMLLWTDSKEGYYFDEEDMEDLPDSSEMYSQVIEELFDRINHIASMEEIPEDALKERGYL